MNVGGEFKLINSSTSLLVYSSQYPHQCNECQKIENFFKTYPYLSYEEKNKGV